MCVCCQAALDVAEKGSHAWGTFEVNEPDLVKLIELWRSMRASALVACLQDDDHRLTAAIDYIALHEEYHVGQLCLMRLRAEPGWDGESIYGG